jgi:predicted nucleotide-binding protein (sugar kinase/HSP70/actin superfamily)
MLRRRRVKDFARNIFENYFQRIFEKALAEPLEEHFGKLAEDPIEHLLDLAEPYIHRSFEGEAILSVGKIVDFHHRGIGGVINVMPFTCMPSTIVTTQTMRISGDCDNMPIINLSFDGQSDPTLITRLEAFVEQVSQRTAGSRTLVSAVI